MDIIVKQRDVDTAGRGGDTMEVIIVGKTADIIVIDLNTEGF